MKKLIFNHVSIVVFILTTALSCNKNNNPPPDNPYGLPNATNRGANIFAYLNNGSPQIVKNSIDVLGATIANDTLAVTGVAGDNNYFENIAIVIAGNLQEGTSYPIDQLNSFIQIATNRICTGFTGNNIQKTFATQGSIFLSKIDYTNKIVSGTFNCKFPSNLCDTINITEGRFDMRYR